MNIRTFSPKAESVAAIMKSLSNPHRLMIVCRLREGASSVGELAQHVALAQSPLSQHLARLRRDGLVRTRREAQTIYYSLADARTARLIQTLFALYCQPEKGEEK